MSTETPIDPGPFESGSTGPAQADLGSTGPGSIDPGSTDPAPGESVRVDAAPVNEDDAVTAPRRGRVAPLLAGVVAVVLAGLFAVLLIADPDRGGTAESPLLGRPAPEALGELDDGTPFDLSRRKGSWVVLNFFTSDCVPCIKEHPELISFVDQQRALGSDGAEFYSVVVADRRERVEEFFAERGGDWPIIYPTAGSAMDVAFGVALVPETWVIDPNGFVRARIISETTAEQLNILLRQLREGVL